MVGHRRATSGMRVEANGQLRAVDVRDHAVPGLPDRPAGAVHGADDARRGHEHLHRDHLREPLHCTPELARMGADIRVDGQPRHRARARRAVRRAGDGDRSARQRLPRCSPASRREGETRVSRVYHLDRGYERLEAKLGALGAEIGARADVRRAVRPDRRRRHARRARRARLRAARRARRGGRRRASSARCRRIIAPCGATAIARCSRCTRRFDGVTLRPATLRVGPPATCAAAYRGAAGDACGATSRLAARRIRAFHVRQRERSWSFRDASRRAPRPAHRAARPRRASTCPAGGPPTRRRC